MWSANRELGTFHLQNSSVSVYSLHFMVRAPLRKGHFWVSFRVKMPLLGSLGGVRGKSLFSVNFDLLRGLGPVAGSHDHNSCSLGRCLVAHDCGYPLSRYTCRATRVAADFLDFTAFCRCSTGVALHPLKILVSHLAPPLSREVSHRNLGLKRCRATRGCRSYSCRCRATLCK